MTIDRRPAPDHGDPRARGRTDAASAVALRDKHLGVWRECDLGRRTGTTCELVGHALLGPRRRARRPGRDPLREPARVAVRRHGRAGRAGRDRSGSTRPTRRPRCGYLLAALGRAGAHRRGPGAGRQGARRARRAAPTCERIVYLEPRGIRHRYDHPKLLSLGRVPRARARSTGRAPDAVDAMAAASDPTTSRPSSTPPAPPGRPRARCSPSPTWSSRSGSWSRSGGVHRPAAGPDDLLLSYLPLCHVAERIFTTWFNAARRRPGQLRRVDRRPCTQNLREVQPTILFGVPRIWEKLLAGVEIRLAGASLAQAGQRRGFWLRGRATASATTLVRTGGRHTAGTRLRYAVGWVFCYRSLRERLGMRRVRYAASGAAPIAPGGAASSSWASACRCTRSTA